MKEDLKIIKRDGKKVPFCKDNVCRAIKNAFDNLEGYTPDDVNEILEKVCKILDDVSFQKKEVHVEYIQNLIEVTLNNAGFCEVQHAFSEYRERRNKARAVFGQRQKRMIKTVEKLTMDSSSDTAKRENANIDGDTPMGTMLQFGSTITKAYAESYLINNKAAEAHDNGDIHIHDMDFVPMGTTTCTQIPLDKLFKNGFTTGHGYLREPKGIMSYSALACIAIQSNQNDQHGGQSIPAFDYYLAPGVLQTFKKELKQAIYDSFDTLDAIDHLDRTKMAEVVDAQTSIEFEPEKLYGCVIEGCFAEETNRSHRVIDKAYNRALKKTDRITFQAMEAFIHNLNTMHCLPASERIWVYDIYTKELDLFSMKKLQQVFVPNKYCALSVDPKTGITTLQGITAIRKSGKKRKLVSITTASGQGTTVTDNHRIMTFNDAGKIVGQVAAGSDNVVVPRTFEFPQVLNDIDFSCYSHKENDHIPLTPEFAEFFGLFCAGIFTVKEHLSSGNWKVSVQENAANCDNVYNLLYSFVSDGINQNIILHEKECSYFEISDAFYNFLLNVFGLKSKQAVIPTRFLFANSVIKQSFLKGIFAVNVCQDEFTGFITGSSSFIKSLNLMILSLGGLSRMSEISGRQIASLTIDKLTARRIGIELCHNLHSRVYSLKNINEAVETPYLSIEEAEAVEVINPALYNAFRVDITMTQDFNSKSEETYDISVHGNETFLTADGIMVHNSRAGAQVPFSSINFGTDVSPEGRMVIKNFLLASDAGLGHGETPIFPISIFKVKEGVNYEEGTKNHDLLELACKVTSKRLFPNFSFIDSSFNKQYYKEGDYNTEIAYMGCTVKESLITYKVESDLYVEGIGRAYERLKLLYPEMEKTTGVTEYIDCDALNVTIFDTSHKGFVKCKKILKNPNKNNWYSIKTSSGRLLYLTEDHPLEVVGLGRTFTKDIREGDMLYSVREQYSEEGIAVDTEEAWAKGFLLGNVLKDEDFLDSHIKVESIKRFGKLESFKQHYGLDPHIPNAVFKWNREGKLAFLAGMIDQFGSIQSKLGEGVYVTLVSTNKELAYGQVALAQAVGYQGRIYAGRYSNKSRTDINNEMLTVNILLTDSDLYKYLALSERGKLIAKNVQFLKGRSTDIIDVREIKRIDLNESSYDVETETDMFDLAGVRSHNCRTRVIGNTADPKNEIVTGRGNLSFTSVNLPRLGIRYGVWDCKRAEPDMQGFYENLDSVMELVCKQLLERFAIQCKKHVYNFPFLMGSGVWLNSDKLLLTDTLKKVLKEGTLSIGFIGLAECLKALTGKHHGECEASQKLGLEIIEHMRKMCDNYSQKYKLNFSLLATPAEGLSGRFIKIDKGLFGRIDGVTDRDYYTNSFHVPVYYNITVKRKMELEAPYHALTNAGHISYIELDGLTSVNPEAIMDVVKIMHDAGIGYGAINHPVDRDPICGYTGIIGDICPCCGRKEGEGVSIGHLKELGIYNIKNIPSANENPLEEKEKTTHDF